MRVWTLCRVHSLTQTFRRALTASVDSCAETKSLGNGAGKPYSSVECPFSGVTNSGRVWRKVPESDARSVESPHAPGIAFRHLPPNSARFSYATEWVYSLSPRSCLATRSAPSKRFHRRLRTFVPKGSCRSNLAPKHARKHETHPPRVKKEKKKVSPRFKRLWFYLC